MKPPPAEGWYELLAREPEAALVNVKLRLIFHCHEIHAAEPGPFHDCAACGVLESQLDRARRALAAKL